MWGELSGSGFSNTIKRRQAWDWRVALVLVVGLAAVVRLAHLGHSSLTGDEAARAHDAWSASLEKMCWYPPLQYAILWTTRHAVGESEFVLRLPNALAGLACVVVLFLFVRKHVDPWSGVCVATVAAFHAELLIYSRMLKEFSIEALMCAFDAQKELQRPVALPCEPLGQRCYVVVFGPRTAKTAVPGGRVAPVECPREPEKRKDASQDQHHDQTG